MGRLIVTCLATSLLTLACSSNPAVDDVSTPPQSGDALDPIVQSIDTAPRLTAPNGQVSVTPLAQLDRAYIGKISLQPHTEVPPHTHQSEEYLIIRQGGGTMTIADREYELTAGMSVAVPEDTEHSFVNGPELTVAIQIFASPKPAQRYQDWSTDE